MYKKVIFFKKLCTILCLTALLTIFIPADVFAADASAGSTQVPKAGTITGVVTDDSGTALSAQLCFISNAKGFMARYQTGWLGRFDITLAPGFYTVEVSKGPEFNIVKAHVQIMANKIKKLNIKLSRLYDLEAMGWYGGDTHQHSIYSDGTQDVETVALSNACMGLSWGVLTDHNTLAGISEWLAANGMRTGTGSFLAIPGEEVTTSHGHFQAIGIQNVVKWKPVSSVTDIERITNDIAAQEGLSQINHPFARGKMGFHMWEARGFGTYEVWNGASPPNLPVMGNAEAMVKWFEMLNSGQFLAATAGSDCHDVTEAIYARVAFTPMSLIEQYLEQINDPVLSNEEVINFIKTNETRMRAWAKYRLYAGNPRTYVHLERLNEYEVKWALANGNSFMTNGPLLLVDVDGQIPGHTAQITPEKSPVLNIKLLSNRPVSKLMVIQGGKTVKELPVEGRLEYSGQLALNPADGNWVVVQAEGAYPIFAMTNPIFLDKTAKQ